MAWIPATAHGSGDATYTVEHGDSIYAIASKFDVAVDEFMAANDLTLVSVLLPGQVVTVPGGAEATSSAPAAEQSSTAGSYTVVAGDSLSMIAQRHGVSLWSLLEVNDLSVSSVILPGMRLDLPAGASAPAPSSTPTLSAASRPASPSRPASEQGSAGSYTVVAGDSLSMIAQRHGVSLWSLLEVNDLSVSSVIVPGMRLALPAGAFAPAPSSDSSAGSGSAARPEVAGSYTVAPGDTLSGIARRHGVSLWSLLDVNDLSVSSLILPGMRLALPAGATTPAPTPAPSAPETTNPPAPTAGAASGAAASDAQAVVDYALAQIGKPYQFFTSGPDTFDCSGLTRAAYAQIGIDLVHQSAMQARMGEPVDLERDTIRPGDLIFTKQRGASIINHVGIAIDADTWVHAPGGGRGVSTGSIPATGSIAEVRRFVDG